MKRIIYILFAFYLSLSVGFAQVNLVNESSNNAVDANAEYKFTTLTNVEATTVKNQAASGTCWSYAGISFIESEILRISKKRLDLSEMYVVRMAYIEKARKYVRMHGTINFGQGGEPLDVLYIIKQYGALPQEVYAGLEYGTNKNQHAELEAVLKAYLDAVIKNENGQLSTAWEKGFAGILDAYLGDVPESFSWESKKYTPRSFADERVALSPDDYISLTSFTHHPFYLPFVLEIPDNWMWSPSYNLPMEEMMAALDEALNNGFSVGWAADVSEKGFSVRNGIAVIPQKMWGDLSTEEQKLILTGPHDERIITQEARQIEFDNYATQDDHSMQFTGIVRDQTGAIYYTVKNSWGEINNPFEIGYVYASSSYVQLKTIALLMHKDALSKSLKKRLQL